MKLLALSVICAIKKLGQKSVIPWKSGYSDCFVVPFSVFTMSRTLTKSDLVIVVFMKKRLAIKKISSSTCCQNYSTKHCQHFVRSCTADISLVSTHNWTNRYQCQAENLVHFFGWALQTLDKEYPNHGMG